MKFFQFIRKIFSHKKKNAPRKIKTRWKESPIISKRTYEGICEAPSCHNTPTGLDVYCCKYCGNYHCPKHRLPEDHYCTGNPKSPPKRDVSYYSRNR